MNLPWPWQCLQLDQTATPTAVRRRYAELLKLNRPEDNPDGFQQLRRAYEICLAFAREREAQTDARADNEVVAAAQCPETATAPDVAPAVSEATESGTATAPPVRVPAQTPAGHDATPVDFALPALRPPEVVVDELLAVDADTPHDSDAFARWFAQCPEFASFISRNVVELALLHRITTGARPTLRALQVLGGAFGWRQLGSERHLLQIGVPREHLRAVDTALFHAGAEAQFDWHLATKQQLIPKGDDTIGVEQEIRLLCQLREQRDRLPRFRALLSGQRLVRVNRLLNGWSQHYGDAATQHLFGAANVAYWRSAHPGAPPNLRQSFAGALRAAILGGVVWLGVALFGALALWHSPNGDSSGFAGLMLTLLVIAVPVIVVINGWRLALHGLARLIAITDAAHERWRERVTVWFAPARALPIGIAAGMLLAIVADRVGGAAAPAGLGLVSAAAFGWRSLAPAAMYAAVGWVMGLAFTGASPTEMPWLIAAALPVPALWFADWLARRRLPHERASLRWRRIVGYSFVYGLLAIVFSVVGAAILDDALR